MRPYLMRFERSSKMNQSKFWSYQLVLVFGITFLISMVLNMQNSILPVFIHSFGGDSNSIGLLTSLFTLSAMIFRPIFGSAVDSKGRKSVLILGIILFAITSILFGFASTLWIILGLRIFQGIGFSGQGTATGTLLTDLVDKEHLPKVFGYNFIMAALSTAVGPILALFLYQNFGYSLFFYITYGLVVISFIGSLWIKQPSHIDLTNFQSFKFNNLFEKSALVPSFIIFLAGVLLPSVFSFLIPFALEKGFTNIGLFFSFYSIFNVIGIKLPDYINKFINTRTVILIGLTLICVAYIILGLSNSLALYLLGGSLMGFGLGNIMPGLQTIAVSGCDINRRGAATATFYSFMDVSFAIGAIMIGYLSQFISLPVIFYIGSFISILSILMYIVLIYRSKSNLK